MANSVKGQRWRPQLVKPNTRKIIFPLEPNQDSTSSQQRQRYWDLVSTTTQINGTRGPTILSSSISKLTHWETTNLQLDQADPNQWTTNHNILAARATHSIKLNR